MSGIQLVCMEMGLRIFYIIYYYICLICFKFFNKPLIIQWFTIILNIRILELINLCEDFLIIVYTRKIY